MKLSYSFNFTIENIKINAEDFNSSEDISCMFENCESLKSIDFTGCDFSNIKYTFHAFKNCFLLEKITGGMSGLKESIDISYSDILSISSIGNLVSSFGVPLVKKYFYVSPEVFSKISEDLLNKADSKNWILIDKKRNWFLS